MPDVFQPGSGSLRAPSRQAPISGRWPAPAPQATLLDAFGATETSLPAMHGFITFV
jgi:hypothetical protein